MLHVPMEERSKPLTLRYLTNLICENLLDFPKAIFLTSFLPFFTNVYRNINNLDFVQDFLVVFVVVTTILITTRPTQESSHGEFEKPVPSIKHFVKTMCE